MYYIIKKSIAVFVVITLLGVAAGGFYSTALAHGNHNEQDQENCRIRVTVTHDEAHSLTGEGTTVGEHPSGSNLDLTSNQAGGENTAGDHGLICVFAIIKFITRIVFFVLTAIATLFIAVAAFLFVTSGGNPSKSNKAKSMLVYAIIGLVVAGIARAIPAIVRGVVGV